MNAAALRSTLLAMCATTVVSMSAAAAIAGGGSVVPPGIEPLSQFTRSPLEVRTSAGELRFDVWLADSPPRRSQGLMFIDHLAPRTGMLFLYDRPQTVSMWMKNTLIPLDMLFIAADGRVTRIARNTTPQSLATISSMGSVTAVLEIGGGESKRLGIEVGDTVLHASFGTAPATTTTSATPSTPAAR